MLYLLDANVLIDANRDYYPLDRVPQFWQWLADLGAQGKIKVPWEVFDKVVRARDDDLSNWLGSNKSELVFDESVQIELLRHAIAQGYSDDLDDIEVSKLNEDPFLVAYALMDPEHRVVVSNEASSPRRQRANRKLPDVCNGFDPRLTCIDIFRLIRELDFKAV